MTSQSSIENGLGIVGGGQLGKMLAIAARSLGIEVAFLDPSKEAVARNVAQHIYAAFDDKAALELLFQKSKAVTFEFENVSLDALKNTAFSNKLFPNLDSLYVANDRIREKEFFEECGLEVAPFVGITETNRLSNKELISKCSEAAAVIGFPVIIKTCSLGYDGKGQITLPHAEALPKVLELKSAGRLIVERRINFSREVSVIAARDRQGNIVVYPTPENVHKDGILFSSFVDKAEPIEVLEQAVKKILNKLNYVGVLAIEFFEVAGKFLANEMAPRVHNTGHWTIEGAICSQFENHVRAVMGLPLGQTGLRFPTAMLNIVGNIPNSNDILRIPGTHLHLYGKEARAARKLGHVTIEAQSEEELRKRMQQVQAFLVGGTQASASAA